MRRTHPGEDDVPNFPSCCRGAAEVLRIPFPGVGGVWQTGAALSPALALGADGINMGTPFFWQHKTHACACQCQTGPAGRG